MVITHFDGRITEFKPLNGDLLGLRKSGTNIYELTKWDAPSAVMPWFFYDAILLQTGGAPGKKLISKFWSLSSDAIGIPTIIIYTLVIWHSYWKFDLFTH